MSKAVLVTGGAKRIGRKVAERAAADGWNVVIHYRSSGDEADSLAHDLRRHGIHAATVAGDLSDPAAAESIVPAAAEALGQPLTALVNSASIFEWDDISTISAEAFTRHMMPNALAPVLLTKHLLAGLPEGMAGCVVNILDQKLAAPYGDHLAYTLSKFALQGATETLARSCAPRLRVNAVAPGYTLPAPGQSQADYERLHSQTPLGHGPTAEEVAGAVCYLLQSGSITGQTIYVDAGMRFSHRQRDVYFD